MESQRANAHLTAWHYDGDCGYAEMQPPQRVQKVFVSGKRLCLNTRRTIGELFSDKNLNRRLNPGRVSTLPRPVRIRIAQVMNDRDAPYPHAEGVCCAIGTEDDIRACLEIAGKDCRGPEVLKKNTGSRKWEQQRPDGKGR